MNSDYYIVSREDLVSIADAIREKCLINTDLVLPTGFISAVTGGVGWTTNGIANGSEPSGDIVYTGTTMISGAFAYRTAITSLKAINLSSAFGANMFAGMTAMEVAVIKSTNTSRNNAWFNNCSKLASLDFQYGGSQLGQTAFQNCTLLTTLIIRNPALMQMWGGTGIFNGTPFASNGTGGTLYVPSALISSYETASNWSTILGYANNQIKSIESTHTDPNAPIDLTLYYADGTLIQTT